MPVHHRRGRFEAHGMRRFVDFGPLIPCVFGCETRNDLFDSIVKYLGTATRHRSLSGVPKVLHHFERGLARHVAHLPDLRCRPVMRHHIWISLHRLSNHVQVILVRQSIVQPALHQNRRNALVRGPPHFLHNLLHRIRVRGWIGWIGPVERAERAVRVA